MNTQTQQVNRVKTMREILGLEEGFSVVTLPGSDQESRPESRPAVFDLPVADQEPKPELKAEPALERMRFKKEWLRYPLLFAAALGFFFVVLNFPALLSQINGPAAAPEREGSAAFADWMSGYYAYSSGQEALQPLGDADRDGLTNQEEFYLSTNPLRADTDEDAYDDGQEVLNGYNPLYEGRLTLEQEQIVAANFDLANIAARKSFPLIAGEVTTFPINLARPGEISIPRIAVTAPVIWSKEFGVMEEDLKSGTAHHPETVYPGQKGLASIHGHSSGNPWDGNFKTVFTKINFLESMDEVFVTVYSESGESRRYRYVVRSKKVYAKLDAEQFAPSNGYFLNLSTSWPVGTAKDRYVVTTELAGY